MRTSQRHIFAIGDVNGLNMLDSSASAQARIAVEAVRGGDTLFSSRWVPRYLDTDPSVVAVGRMENDAKETGFEVDRILEPRCGGNYGIGHFGLNLTKLLQFGVFWPDQERSAKTGGGCGLRLGDTDFRSCILGRVSRNEVIHRLFGRESVHR